jgi:hypothetical protein
MLHAEAQIDLVEAHICVLTLTARRLAHAEKYALRHGRHRKDAKVALRAGADGPGALRMVLLEEKLDRGAVGVLNERSERCLLTHREVKNLQKPEKLPTVMLYLMVSVYISLNGVAV